MAKDDKRSFVGVDKKINNLSKYVDRMYQTTYSSRSDNKNALDNITDTIDDNIDALISRVNGQNISDISNLYTRLNNARKTSSDATTKRIQDSIESLFDEKGQLLDTINMDNIRRSIIALDYQYDIICKYMPKMEDALEIKKDNVLSSDNFTKEFISIVSNKNNTRVIDQFNKRAGIIKEKYKVQDLFEEMYDTASKYGEYFLYHVPYKKGFEALLKRKKRYSLGIRYESGDLLKSEKSESVCIFESSTLEDVFKKSNINQEMLNLLKENNVAVNLIFDDSYIIPEPIETVYKSKPVKEQAVSLTEAYFSENGELDSFEEAKGELSFEDDGLSSDGFITKNNSKQEEISDNMCGSVIYEIPRRDIIPLYMGRDCIGYLYVRIHNDYVVENMFTNGTYNSLTNSTKLTDEEFDKNTDLMIHQISSMMSEKIDAKFINANMDLKEQIYSVLRHNDDFCTRMGVNNITCTFLPAEDVYHFFFKQDKKTHRGISDLHRGMIPAMVYCMLYLNTSLAEMSRAQDKRVYYVKQNVEQNVARTLLNVVNQLKKGNMGMRQLENMNSMFNIIGKFNDHIIPVSQSGDSPIQMEVMQGQDVQTPTELLERMEDAAISTTDVPLEFIQSVNQVDYASRFTMSNSKFLRKVYKRQRICQNAFTVIFRKLYNFEYKENDTSMKLLLPAPAYLAMSNCQQLLDNIKNHAQSVADIVCFNEEDEVRNEFINVYTRNQLGTYIDFDQVNEMIQMAKLNMESKKNLVNDAPGGEDYGSDYSDY